MKKIINIGTRGYGQIFCKITFENGKLSITGVEGPMRNGNCKGSCGQIEMGMNANEITPSEGWTTELIQEFLTVWRRWHHNDMKPNCEHQTDTEWDTGKKIETIELTWGDVYYKNRCKAQTGELTVEEYELFQCMQAVVDRKGKSKFIDDTIQMAIDAGILKIKETKTESAGWVRSDEHPEGLLCKPCPVCGYKYGTQWLKEDVPAEVIIFLESLPKTKIHPAWI